MKVISRNATTHLLKWLSSVFRQQFQDAAISSIVCDRLLHSYIYFNSMPQMKQPACPFCNNQIDKRDHFDACPKCEPVIKHAKHAIHFQNKNTICLKCFQMMMSNSYINHNRNCGRAQKKLSSQRMEKSSLSIVARSLPIQTEKKKINQRLEQLNEITPNPKRLIKAEQIQESLNKSIYVHCQNYLMAYLRPHLLNWLQKNQHINSIVLFKIFQRYCRKTVESLELMLPNIQISSVYQLSKRIDWKKIILRIEDIYNKELILSRINPLPEPDRNLVMKGLNKLYSKYDKGIFQLFKIKKEVRLPKNPRQKNPLLPCEFLKILNALFSTQILGFVLIALQLLIIYQSGQRFPSCLQKIQQSLVKLLKDRKKNKKQNSFFIISTKTQRQENVIFDEQILELLQIFQWKKFSQNKRFFQRLSHFFPFSCYSMRRGFICYMYVFANTDASSAMRLLTNHVSTRNVGYYIRSIVKSTHLQAKIHLRIANSKVHTASLDSLISSLPLFSVFTDKIQLEQQWFSKTFHKLKSVVDMSTCDCLQVKISFQQPVELMIDQKNEQQVDKNQENVTQSSEDELEDLIKEQVTINGKIYQMVNYKFNFLNQYTEFHVNSNPCSVCNEKCEHGYLCNNCGDFFHQKCLSQMFCQCHKSNFEVARSIQIKNIGTKREFILKMPQQYFKECFEFLYQIKFLVFMRGLNFTNVSIKTQDCHQKCNQIEQIKQKISVINLPQYSEYQSYKYFPPLRLMTFGDSNVTGTGFGLCATQDINQTKIFLGEYAGDVFFNYQSKFVQRKDMIMELQYLQCPSKSLNIGPIRYGGYVMLVNESKEGNCAVIKAIVNGMYKILLYNTKRIRKGMQLLYSYNRITSDFVEDRDDQFAEQNITTQPTKDYILINNTISNCYVNVILQLLWKYKSYIIKSQQTLSPLIIQLQSFLNLKSGTYDPSKFLSLVFSNTSKFLPKRQQDSHQFLDFIIEHLHKQHFSIEFLFSKKKIQQICSNCKRIEESFIQVQLIILEQLQNPFDSFQRSQISVSQHTCTKCMLNGTTTTLETYEQFGKILIFVINRFRNYPNVAKDQTKIWSPSSLKLNDSIYTRKVVIIHKGITRENGHYIFIDLEKKIEINDDKLENRYSFRGMDVSMVIYQKS